MQTLSFTPGRALLESSPVNRTWSLRFEDEGTAAYLYVCDRALGHGDASILDAMLIYNVAALREATTAAQNAAVQNPAAQNAADVSAESPSTDLPSALPQQGAASEGSAQTSNEPERLAAIEWSRDGVQAVFYLDGTAQAMVDFARHVSFCRSDFPNFLAEGTSNWRSSSHAWDAAAIEQFEATLYA